MKNVLREYIDLTEKEKKDLWENSIFIFDTNILLNLYRYSSKTRSALINSIQKLKDNIWLPYNIAAEFLKNRCEVIYNSEATYNRLLNEMTSFVDSCKESLRLDNEDKEILALREMIKKWIEDNREKNVLVTNPYSDEILNNILELYDNKVGEPFNEAELKEIEKEGENRYKNSIPPGYKDEPKQKGNNDNNKYGDLIIWKQILKHSKENSKNIIFVTNDTKEDWWKITLGKKIGPRYELIKEFNDTTEQKFLMYTMKSFINYYNKYYEIDIDQAVIEEMSIVNKADKFNIVNQYYIDGMILDSNETLLRLLKDKKLSSNDKEMVLLKAKVNSLYTDISDIYVEYKNVNDLPINVKQKIMKLQNEVTIVEARLEEIYKQINY